MDDAYPIIVISNPSGEKAEPMGTKRKFWVSLPDERWLFKYNRPGNGEDWSEKLAAEIAPRLRVAAARVDLAECEAMPGAISKNFIGGMWKDGRLVHGNELLSGLYHGRYPANKSYGVNQHCVASVREVLSRYPTSDHHLAYDAGPLKTLWHLFAGYLMLDALIGNTDRHHENWGIITPSAPAKGSVALAPSFDHASSLGRELSDAARLDMLSGAGNRDIALYAERGRSKLYSDDRASSPLTPLQAFMQATQDAPDVRKFWRDRLADADRPQFAADIRRVPAARMSDAAGRFALELLVYNRARLLSLD